MNIRDLETKLRELGDEIREAEMSCCPTHRLDCYGVEGALEHAAEELHALANYFALLPFPRPRPTPAPETSEIFLRGNFENLIVLYIALKNFLGRDVNIIAVDKTKTPNGIANRIIYRELKPEEIPDFETIEALDRDYQLFRQTHLE